MQNRRSGVFVIELPELDVFTEASSIEEIHDQVNDLIYTYFDIPKKYQGEIVYCPPKMEGGITAIRKMPIDPIQYRAFYSSSISRLYAWNRLDQKNWRTVWSV